MKRRFWFSIAVLLLAGSVHAQSLTGAWQGVETDTGEPGAVWPAVLRLQKSKNSDLFGVLYQEVGGQPHITVTFQMLGRRTDRGMQLDHIRKLNETGRTPNSYWCDGSIAFTYDASQEKLTGHATYRPVGDCDVGTFTFYRIKLKSPATVQAGTESTIRVSGRNVKWYADAELRQPLATGNTYRTRLSKTTTFYLTQDYYPTSQSPVVPITVKTTGTVAKAAPKRAPPPPPPVRPDTTRPDTARPAPAPTIVAPTPVVLPTVLFKVGTPELLPEVRPALDQLAAELKARPGLRIRVSGYTDRVGEHDKNQILSEQRATAVKDYLMKAGVAADRISTIGYGDSRPLFTSPDVRNRRVEVEAVW
jgi:outer membrane protein OmpA-like peptidoglycan-associated protein